MRVPGNEDPHEVDLGLDLVGVAQPVVLQGLVTPRQVLGGFVGTAALGLLRQGLVPQQGQQAAAGGDQQKHQGEAHDQLALQAVAGQLALHVGIPVGRRWRAVG